MAEGLDPETLSQFLNYPIQAPPPGVIPNFVNPGSTAYQVYITAGLCIPLMLGFAASRFSSKFCNAYKTFLTDDIIFVIGLVLCIGFISMTIACLSGSVFGRHAWNVLLGGFTKSQLVLALLVEILAPQALCFVKVSVLILYLRIFSVIRWMRIASIIAIILVVAFHLAVSICFAVMCSPSTGDSQLDFLAAFISESCNKTRVLVVIQGAGSVISDFFLLVLPLPAVWKLQMPIKRKLAVSSMFLVGTSALVSSILSLYYRTLYYAAGEDNIRLVVPLWATAMAEEAAGVIVCCMPATAALFRKVKMPMPSWSSISKWTSRSPILLSGSSSNLKENLERHESINSRNPVYCHPGSRDRHAAWVDSEAETHSLQHLNLGNTGIGKQTGVEVSWQTK
ncbi:hypothetical protein GQX73_g3175 [Xylaria multiplex]|uniref:Rhodopsin domain-containing protein n=1 Tax=Xylaria multiplex TaxID=323545 RepID=A0A7C8IXQ2_9PEZI|nr:hypothetical protein GQX73_g3175 [Xylaria multiplex]